MCEGGIMVLREARGVTVIGVSHFITEGLLAGASSSSLLLKRAFITSRFGDKGGHLATKYLPNELECRNSTTLLYAPSKGKSIEKRGSSITFYAF